jgi:DNA-directed RNA polymerase subunit E"
MFIEGHECPVCRTSQFSNSWQGRLSIIDASKSLVAEKIGIKSKGEYAIKVR